MAGKNNMDVDVFSGYRSMEEQAKLYSHGRTIPGDIITNAKPGHSFHNWGLAADVVFKVNRNWDWGPRNRWDRLGQIGKAVGLEWGGDFKTFPDKPHFQLTGGLTIVEALELDDIGDVWEEVSKRLDV